MPTNGPEVKFGAGLRERRCKCIAGLLWPTRLGHPIRAWCGFVCHPFFISLTCHLCRFENTNPFAGAFVQSKTRVFRSTCASHVAKMLGHSHSHSRWGQAIQQVLELLGEIGGWMPKARFQGHSTAFEFCVVLTACLPMPAAAPDAMHVRCDFQAALPLGCCPITAGCPEGAGKRQPAGSLCCVAHAHRGNHWARVPEAIAAR